MNKKNNFSLVPRLRFPDFMMEAEWIEDTLINIAGFRRGSFPQPYGLPEWYDDINGMPFIQVYDVGEDFRLKTKTKNKISKLAAEQSVFIPKGTLIITIQGSIGRVAITQYDAYIDRTLLLFEEFYIELDKTFFAYLLFLLFEIEKLKAPGGIIKTITKEVLSQFVVKLPSPKEQQKIASCLSSLDDVIKTEKQKLDTLKEHKKGLLQNLFPQEGETVPKLRFKEFEDSGEWEEKTLGEIAEIITGNTPPTNDVHNYNGNNLFVSPADISETRYVVKTKTTLTDKGFSLTRHLKENSVLFVCIGSTIGKIAQNKFECATNQQINSLVPYKGFSSAFLYSLLDCNSSKIASIAGKHAIPLINKTSFSAVRLFFPPSLAEQHKIASCFSSIDDLIDVQSQKIKTLNLHKKGLMQGLFPTINDEKI